MKRFFACMTVLVLFICLIPASALPAQEYSISKEAILSALYEADIATIREAIDLRLITCEELTAYYQARIAAYNKPYNCFITLCDDALEVARKRDEALAEGTAAGLLFGIPIVLKDNIDLAGYHTTNGHKKTDDQIPESNAKIVDYLLAQGAVIIGKANMSTDAQSARDSTSQVAGQTKNAYNKYLSAAGSSGGSAVATSLNFTAAGVGTDTNSSLRLPAAYAGCISLRTTFDLIPRDGVTKLNGTRDAVGSVTRTVYDQAIVLDVLTEGKFSYTENLNDNALAGLRIGVLKELSYAVPTRTGRHEEDLDPEVVAAFAAAVEELRNCGAEVVEISFPKVFTLSSATLASNEASDKLKLYNAFMEVMETNNISAVVFPTYLTTPLRSGTDADGKYWNVWDQTFTHNCAVLSPSASLPEITVPIGLHSLGCGIGMEIAAAKNQEQLLLDIAYTYTKRYDHRAVPTGAPDTYADANIGSLSQIIADYKLHLEQEPSVPDTTVPTVPTVPTTQPTVPTTQPTVPTTQPTAPTTQPTVPTTQPTAPTTQPTAPTTQPTAPTTQPTAPTTQPTAPTTQPTAPTTQPTEPTTQPTAPTTQPTEPTTRPTMPPSQPSVEPAPRAPKTIVILLIVLGVADVFLLYMAFRRRR